MLGILLQALHVLFGITAIIGMFIAHTRISGTQDTVYHSHLKWQLTTFWVAFVAYALAAALWIYTDNRWPMLVVAGFVAYRLCINVYYWRLEQPINRIL